jgi:hypothetical protein
VALERLRVSFFIGVALVPTLLAQVFTGVQELLPWWAWSLLLLAVIGTLFARAARADLRLQRRMRGTRGQVGGVRNLDTVTDLVATAHLGKPSPQPLHTLLPALPGVTRVHLVVGELADGATDPQLEAQALMARAGRSDVPVRILGRLPITRLDAEEVESLQDKLTALGRSLEPTGRALVDVTGGTSPMTLATYRAALGAGLPVTYISSRPPRTAGGTYTFLGLIALHDPLGDLTEGGI